MPDKTPHKHPARFPFVGFRCAFLLRLSGSFVRFRSRLFQGFPFPCLNNRIPCFDLPSGRCPWGFPSSWRISSRMPRPVDSGGPPHPCLLRVIRVAFKHVKTLGIRNRPSISKLYQHFRERGFPYGLRDSLSTLHLSCSPDSSPTPPQAQDSIRVGG